MSESGCSCHLLLNDAEVGVWNINVFFSGRVRRLLRLLLLYKPKLHGGVLFLRIDLALEVTHGLEAALGLKAVAWVIAELEVPVGAPLVFVGARVTRLEELRSVANVAVERVIRPLADFSIAWEVLFCDEVPSVKKLFELRVCRIFNGVPEASNLMFVESEGLRCLTRRLELQKGSVDDGRLFNLHVVVVTLFEVFVPSPHVGLVARWAEFLPLGLDLLDDFRHLFDCRRRLGDGQ